MMTRPARSHGYLALLAAAAATTVAATASALDVLELPDGKRSTLQAALEQAQSATEQTVIVLPDGAWDYGSSGVEIDRLANVVIMGQGAGRTRLYRSVCHGGAILRVNESENLRITGIKFDGCDATSTDVSAVGVHLWDAKNFRVDHCAFKQHSWAAVRIHGEHANPRGVVDHCSFERIFQGKHEGYGVGVTNNGQFLHEPFGSAKATFIEDCTFDRTRHAATANGAGRYVFRYNSVTNNQNSHAVDAHGAEGASATGTEWVEIYRNVIKQPVYNLAAIRIRGGKGLVWDNEVRGYQVGVSLWEETSASTGPVRLWSNDFGSAQAVGDLRGSPSWSTGKPSGYTPYTYPHPLVTDLEAKAGWDQKVIVGATGVAQAYVDASSSKVQDGSIVAYRWYDQGALVSSCARDILDLAQGPHTLVLETERSDGLREYDTAIVQATANEPISSNESWRNRWFVPIAGQGTIELDVTPTATGMNGYVGFTGRRRIDAHDDLAVRVRFNASGKIDARNGSASWSSASPASYAANVQRHLTITVDVPAGRFSVAVDGVPLAQSYAFETNVKTIGQIALWHASGSLRVENVVVTGSLAAADAACVEQMTQDDEPTGEGDDGGDGGEETASGDDGSGGAGPEPVGGGAASTDGAQADEEPSLDSDDEATGAASCSTAGPARGGRWWILAAAVLALGLKRRRALAIR